MGATADDWRLRGQERWLRGARLAWKRYAPPRPGWDHDHCAFCWAKFMAVDAPDVLREGWCTEDRHQRWVCAPCFDDFRERFAFEVVGR